MTNWGQIIQNVGKYGGIAGTAIGIGSKIMGLFGSNKSASEAAATNYKYNLALQQQAQQWNEYMYRNRYQMQVEDLEKAGINKLYGLGTAPSVTTGANSAGMPDTVGEQNNKFNQIMSLLDFGQNLSAKKAQTKLLERQAQTEEQNTLLRTEEVLREQLNNKFLPKTKMAELKKLYSDTILNMAKTNESYAESKLKNAMTGTELATSGKIKRYEKWARENPNKAKIWEKLTENQSNFEIGKGLMNNGMSALRLLLK